MIHMAPCDLSCCDFREINFSNQINKSIFPMMSVQCHMANNTATPDLIYPVN